MRRALARLTGGLQALFRKNRVEQEVDAELRAFLDTAVDQKMRDGLTRDEALRAARIELGSAAAVKDRVRDVGWESVVESTWQDVRYGARTLRRSPGFAATAIGILALGIGANTAIFSLLNAVMLRTLPVHEPAQLVEPLSRFPGDPRMNGYKLDFYEYVRDLLVTLNAQGSGYNRTQLTVLYKDLLDRFDAIPGVRSATHCGVAPIDGGAASSFATVEGFQEKPEDRRRVHQNWVGPRYFETLGTPFVAGRDFQYADADRPRVAIVNQAMARYYFGTASPLGRRLTFERDTVPFEIVGVVGDAKYETLQGAAPRTAYLNAFQGGRIQTRFALRTEGNPTAVAPQVRRAVEDVLKTVRIGHVTTLSDQVDASLVLERVMATLSGMFGALGACLAAIGVYGLLAYTVTTRTNEIGVRMALGATSGDVTRMVLKGAFGLVCAGLVIGVPVAVASQRFAASLVPGLAVKAAIPIGMASVIMIAIALLAAYVPARRAARVQPVTALRHT